MSKQEEQRPDAIGSGSVLSSVAGPSTPLSGAGVADPVLVRKVTSGQQLAEQLPAHADKALEYGDAARVPHAGMFAVAPDPLAGASTASEHNASDKLGCDAADGVNRTIGPLDRARVDSTAQELTTNQGVAVADNQNSLKIGLRGPTALEDFILREKITHFDHERIPERVVHARGSAAHGIFEAYEDLSDLTRAAPFQAAGKVTPVFVRFSTVAGERGSADTARDVRGFAVKFYTDEGNWDLVGNNMPVFFIQDAMKFPDLIHAVKPEPNNAIPQASSAHDTFWDFVSLTPESTHMLMWQMSDRAIPRSFRMMQGFGVHTFRLVNAAGESVFCKFHWLPLAGTHSLVWDEAVKIMGADPDFHRRDLWEAIEAGAYPQWELGLQVFTEEQASQFPFDVLDPTKLVPEELVPVRIVGRMTLNRNPDNFFAETEQVAFCAAHVIPGIDFTNDPLLQGRIHSYLDTQISRLGGPNFHELPINAPLSEVHNNQRDGMHRQAIHRGRASYEPNSLGGGCPFQAGSAGFHSFPEHIVEDKVRGKPEQFAEHFAQARLFFESQSPAEQAHIANAFRFELSKVQSRAVRTRMVANLVRVDPMLASVVADGLGLALLEATPLASTLPAPTYAPSPSLSLLARPGATGVATRRVAVLVDDGVDSVGVKGVYTALLAAGAVPRLVSLQLGTCAVAGGGKFAVEMSLETGPSVLYDAVIVPDGVEQGALAAAGQTHDFLRDQFRHCKPIFAWGGGVALLNRAGVPADVDDERDDPALILTADAQEPGALDAFMAALGGHRAFGRESEPSPE